MPTFTVPVDFTISAANAEYARDSVVNLLEDYGLEFPHDVMAATDPAAPPTNRITKADIDTLIARSTWSDTLIGVKTTVVCLTLPNGFEIIETASCVDPANYDHDLGVTTARKRVIDKLWLLEGYRLACELQDIHFDEVAFNLAVDLRKMNAEGAIELETWPNAKALVELLA